MSARQRADANRRAVEPGRAARLAGEPKAANPYKQPVGNRIGAWSLHPAWWLGLAQVDNELRAAQPK